MAACYNCRHPRENHGLSGCEHRMDPARCDCPMSFPLLESALSPPCPARWRKRSGTEVSCIEPAGHDGKHKGYYDPTDKNPCTWPEEQSVRYEAAESVVPRVIMDALEANARDSQVGGEHYLEMPIQPWAIIDAFNLGYYEGSALKYLLRAGRKGSKLEDLKKARHYLEKLIELEEEEG